MKRLAALLAASLLLAGCAAAHKAVQVPEYPWDTTQQAVQQACPDAVAEDNSVLIETGALFGVPAQGIRLTYDGGRLAGVVATVQAQDRDALLASMQKALGAPVESYTPAMQNALSSGFRVDRGIFPVPQGGRSRPPHIGGLKLRRLRRRGGRRE